MVFACEMGSASARVHVRLLREGSASSLFFFFFEQERPVATQRSAMLWGDEKGSPVSCLTLQTTEVSSVSEV